jgi:putative component of toxin-antitoxin plasmid stabilization module
LPIANHFGEVCANCGSIWGLGYRVYYAMLGKLCVLLLAVGERKQSSDIERAIAYLKDYKERTGTV